MRSFASPERMKIQALKENHLFRLAYRRGARKSSRTVTVYALKDRAAETLRKKHPLKLTVNRVGISASKKVGGAVQRNRAKRLIREAWRQIDKTLGIKRGFLVVIVPKPECTVSKMQQVQRDLGRCLSSLDMLQRDPGQDPEPEKPQSEPKEETPPSALPASVQADP